MITAILIAYAPAKAGQTSARRHPIRSGWVVLPLVLVLILVSLGGCRGKRQEAVSPWDVLVAQADKRWPRPAVLEHYEQLLDMYEDGKGEAALPLLRRLVDEPVRLAPDRAWGADPDTYHLDISLRQAATRVEPLTDSLGRESRLRGRVEQGGQEGRGA